MKQLIRNNEIMKDVRTVQDSYLKKTHTTIWIQQMMIETKIDTIIIPILTKKINTLIIPD